MSYYRGDDFTQYHRDYFSAKKSNLFTFMSSKQALIKKCDEFYEIFKDVYAWGAGKDAAKYKTIGWAISSASAEFIADVLLCPWEAVSNN